MKLRETGGKKVEATMKDTGSEKLAEIVAERLSLSCPPNLSAVAEQLGLRIREVEADGFEGALVRALDKQKGIVAVNSRIREETRRRFTIAHEIGHFLIPHHRLLKNVCGSEDIESWRQSIAVPEREANSFAAELLLPRKYVAPRFDLKNPSLCTIRGVASDFAASLTATACRFVELTDSPCCVVWSERGQTKWYFPSKTLPARLPVAELPSPQSWAARLFAGETAPDDLSEVPVEAWVDRRDARVVRNVFEHSLFLKSYSAVLSFLEFALEPGMIRDDEDDLLAPLDPNRYDSRLRRR
jgi:Zn-dependent peptidase ImmA (M78 family)